MSWLKRLFQRRRLERELDAELRFHLEEHVRDLVAAGVEPAEARRQARLALGGVEQVKEEARDVRGTRWLEDLAGDIRFALRTLRKAPGFTVAAVLTLAFGIGANTAVYSVADALFFRTLPVERPMELFHLERVGPAGPDRRFSGPAFNRFRAALPEGARLAAMSTTVGMNFIADQPAERVAAQLVSGDWFSVLGTKAQVGRLIGPNDARAAGGEPVAVLSHPFWTRRFGADSAVVGRTIRLNGAVLTVIGVAEPGFTGFEMERSTDVWAPATMQVAVQYYANANIDNAAADEPWFEQEGISWLTLVARIPGRRGDAAVTARLQTVFRAALDERLASADSATRAYRAKDRLALQSAARGFSDLRDGLGNPLKLLTITVGLVLLVACANLAGLLLARNAARGHEVAVRISLGARGGRLLRQVLTESVTLSVLGGIAGVAVAWVGASALLRAAWNSTTPGLPVALAFDWKLLLVSAGISLVTGVLFGLPPALKMSRTELFDAFRSTGRVMGGRPGQSSVGRSLVVGQIGLSLTLVVIAGVLVRSVQALMAVDPGYDQDQVLSARIDVRGAGYRPEELPALYRRVQDIAAAVPGVKSAALSSMGLAGNARRTSSIQVPGKVRPPGWDDGVQVNEVSVGFIGTTGIRLLKGRDFAVTDGPKAPNVAIISESMARRFFDTKDAVGLRFGFDSVPAYEVIGIVGDLRPNGLKEAPVPFLLLSLEQQEGAFIYNLMARTTMASPSVAVAVRQALAAAEPGLPVRDVVTIGTLLARGARQDVVVSRVTGMFGLLAALLAAIGLYGVMAYSVSRRSNELGVRLALGAAPVQIRWLVIGDSMRLVVAGVVVGLGVTMLSLRAVKSLVFGVSPRDPVAVGVAVAILLAVGLAAAAVPAWKASRVDPVIALRRD